MTKVLNIITSPRGEASYSNQLGNAVLEKIKSEYPGIEVITRDLSRLPFPQLSAEYIEAFSTPLENHTALHKQATQASDEAIKQLLDIDVVVINVAMWNFGMPSSLKAWIDQIARVGITFNYSEKGAVGLIPNKKVFVAMASGGVYSEGPYLASDFISPYLKLMLGFLGITDVTIYRVEGLGIPGIKETAFEKALKSIEESEITA